MKPKGCLVLLLLLVCVSLSSADYPEDYVGEAEDEGGGGGGQESDIGSVVTDGPSNANVTYQTIDSIDSSSELTEVDDRDCPRNREEAVARGRTCLRKCTTDVDCISNKKRCLCDGLCGWSCVRPDLVCDELTPVSNGHFRLTGNFFNANVSYQCNEGYFLSGVRRRFCQGDSSWSDAAPECKTKPLCGAPPAVSHAKHSALESQETEFELNTTLTYACFNGYEVVGGVDAVCVFADEAANWKGPNLECKPISCGEPGEIENGYKESSGNVFTARVNYNCNKGYVLSGRAIRYCQSNGQWSGDLPSCQPIKCPQPRDPENGRAFYDSGFVFGACVTYQCQPGYQLFGPSNRTCLDTREWSDREPECKIIDCGSPGLLPNGYIEVHGTTIGSMIKFICFDGMVYSGSYNTSTCSAEGVWVPRPFPQCLAGCAIPSVANGEVLGDEGLEGPSNYLPMERVPHGQWINITCIQDYELENSRTGIQCLNGTWSQLPICRPASCRKLPSRPKRGFVIATKLEHGMKAKFRCADGYRLEGSNVTWCHFGQWNITSPKCNEIYCPFPGYIESGSIMLVGHMGMYDYRPYVRRVPHGKQIMYECERGYHIEGPPGATCVDGHWSPIVLPTCEPTHHSQPQRWSRSVRRWMPKEKHPPGSRIIISGHNNSTLGVIGHKAADNNKDKHKVAIEDQQQQPTTTDYHIRRRRRRHFHGKHNKPSCVRLPEKPWMNITVIRYGHAHHHSSGGNDTTAHNNNNNGNGTGVHYPHGTRVRLVCEDGYVLTNITRTMAKCAKGVWKPEPPDCVPAPCVTPTLAHASFFLDNKFNRNATTREAIRTLTPGQLVRHRQSIKPLCDHGYQLSTNIIVRLRCTFGTWDTSARSLCTPKKCRLPALGHSGQYVTLRVGQVVQHETLVEFRCPDKTNDTVLVTSCVLGTWQPLSPQCTTSAEVEQYIGSNSSSSSSTTSCRSPQKIENALRYFSELFAKPSTTNASGGGAGAADVPEASRLTLIGIAQFDKPVERVPRSSPTTGGLPFEYRHGTEIAFKCVYYDHHQRQPREPGYNRMKARSTWIIRCENGNWIGRSFDCEERDDTGDEDAGDDKASVYLTPKKIDDNTPAVGCDLRQIIIGANAVQIYHDDRLVNFDDTNGTEATNPFVGNGTHVWVRCEDIGKYRLLGPNHRTCVQGRWVPEHVKSECEGLSSEFDYDPNRPPTIMFRHRDGKIAQMPNGKLRVVPGTILHLDCLWRRKLGNPKWTPSSEAIDVIEDWNTDPRRDSSLEYTLTFFRAKPEHSRVYTCETPTRQNHSIEIEVMPVSCPSVNISHQPYLRIANNANTTSGNELNTVLTFGCLVNATLQGPTSIRCLSSGRWSDEPPRCEVKQCPDLETLLLNSIPVTNHTLGKVIQAQVKRGSAKVGDRVLLACPKRYGLVGQGHDIECQKTGVWSGPIPYCQEVRCEPPLVPEHGLIEGLTSEGEGRYYAGDLVQYECEPGYRIFEGTPISVCQENGRWSGPTPVCRVACSYPGLNHAMRVASQLKHYYQQNETIKFECNEGYQMTGANTIKCIADKTAGGAVHWSGPLPQCHIALV